MVIARYFKYDSRLVAIMDVPHNLESVLMGLASLPAVGALTLTAGAVCYTVGSTYEKLLHNPDGLTFKELYNKNWVGYFQLETKSSSE